MAAALATLPPLPPFELAALVWVASEATTDTGGQSKCKHNAVSHQCAFAQSARQNSDPMRQRSWRSPLENSF